MFLLGFFAGFITALALIVGVIVLPIILGVVLVLGIIAYFRYRKEQKRREEILREFWGE
ncbi:hypothetical protein BCF55_1783 [Hydrogenivirga caldilitoris]|uniref:Uncharacterized protein n=1 Tax=Hydrogenivirga caldilitoris TaxID=246264 RepID=A0A497XT89_9AQUI|nr:hypothetical protein [Hydrogenivirga caldilitoris]RLJ71481.1 hypothetical protein BCF55_1783 [Hydrogenivirga caldilitoris]